LHNIALMKSCQVIRLKDWYKIVKIMDRSLVNIKVLGLATQCPAGIPLAGCPISKMARRLGLRDTYRLISVLNDAEIFELFDKHLNCYYKRLDCTPCEDVKTAFKVSWQI